MPYIDQKTRDELEPALKPILDKIGLHTKKGELTYILYSIALKYLNTHGRNYNNISETISSVTDVEAEMRRRILGPYEDQAIQKNGDI